MADETVNAHFFFSMADQALAHGEGLPHRLVHCLDRAMTRLALDAGANMRPMLKKNKIGDRENSDPLNRLLLIPMILDLLNLRLIRRSNLVTAHASFHRRDASYCSVPGIGVAILAGYFKIPGVNLMAKVNGLLSHSSATKAAHDKSAARDGEDSNQRKNNASAHLFHPARSRLISNTSRALARLKETVFLTVAFSDAPKITAEGETKPSDSKNGTRTTMANRSVKISLPARFQAPLLDARRPVLLCVPDRLNALDANCSAKGIPLLTLSEFSDTADPLTVVFV